MQAIPLGNTEFEGLNNAYLFDGDDSVALVDTAIATDTTREQLRSGLAEHGYGYEDVDDIVLTHWHPDHAGLAGELQAAADATVYVHEADAPLVRRDEEALESFREKQAAKFAEWGIPDGKLDELLARLDRNTADIFGPSPTLETITGGDVLTVGGTTFRTIHAPGHTAGLCCFAFEGDVGGASEEGDADLGGRRTKAVLTGDAILPVYTPNVGGADVRLEEPLAAYLETLRSLADADFARAWPGHRDVIDDPAGRAWDIVDHHEERTNKVLAVLEDRTRADPWTVSADLFGELKGIHIMHGPGEAYAHLDHLTTLGSVERRGSEYELVDGRGTDDVHESYAR